MDLVARPLMLGLYTPRRLAATGRRFDGWGRPYGLSDSRYQAEGVTLRAAQGRLYDGLTCGSRSPSFRPGSWQPYSNTGALQRGPVAAR